MPKARAFSGRRASAQLGGLLGREHPLAAPVNPAPLRLRDALALALPGVLTKSGIGSDSVKQEPCIVGLRNLRPLGRGGSQLVCFLAPATQITAANVTPSIVQLTFSWSSNAAKPSPMKGWSN